MHRRGATEVAVERRGYVHNSTSIRSVLIALAAVVMFALTPAPTQAQNVGGEYALGVSCGLVNLIYGPVKIIYATGGAIISGLAWVFSAGDTDVAKPIWDASMRGDYVIVPDHLQGREQLEFIGRSPEHVRATEPPVEQEFPDEGF
jgi:hypothetical protein